MGVERIKKPKSELTGRAKKLEDARDRVRALDESNPKLADLGEIIAFLKAMVR